MNSTSPQTFSPIQQAIPPALIFLSQRLLTEKSSVKVDEHPLTVVTEIFTVHATVVTTILKAISGYDHFGINE